MPPALHLIRTSCPGRPALDTAISRAILERVSNGELPETYRLWRPEAIVTFGRLDAVSDGYVEAVEAAHARGFAAVERLEGGHAAVFHEGTVAFAHAVPDATPPLHTHDRFEETASLMARALGRLGIRARVGEVRGEYCPGAYSVNARGRRKLMGVGQRVVARAAHVGGVVVAADSRRVRDVLVPVYEALRLEWEPGTAGSAADELGEASYDTVEAAILAELADRYELVEASIDVETVALAEQLEPDHEAPSPTRSPAASAAARVRA